MPTLKALMRVISFSLCGAYAAAAEAQTGSNPSSAGDEVPAAGRPWTPIRTPSSASTGDEETPNLSREARGTKAGAVMLNLRGGAGLALFVKSASMSAIATQPYAQAVFGAELAYGFGREHNIYLTLPLSLHYISGSQSTQVIVPIGVHIDLPIRSVPGLYLYPRVSLGYAGIFASGLSMHAVVLTPEFGIKYVFSGRFNLGLEPFSLPLVTDPIHGVSVGSYRATLHVGVNL